MERVKLDQVVDIFQTIKLLRVKRPGAVETLVRLSVDRGREGGRKEGEGGREEEGGKEGGRAAIQFWCLFI